MSRLGSRSGRSSAGRSSAGRSESEDSEKEPVDFSKDSQAYFASLQRQSDNADKTRAEEKDQEKTLMEYLPVNERFSLNKEGKVLARWQERQRDWDRIQSQLTRRLASKVKRPLMMSTTDEYRTRMEEYDLIQAAMPVKDRYSDNSWQVLLRGGGPIRVPVGHIFSGIECEVDMELPHPKMVRKPKPPQNVLKNDTFLEQTDAYVQKKTKYEQSMREIRPHTMTYQDAGAVVVRSKSLFKWAKESSEAYFKEQEELQRLSLIEEESQAHLSDEHQASTNSLQGESAEGPKIEFQSPREVVFDALPGNRTMKKIYFKNTGTTSLTYGWRRVIDGSEHRPEDHARSYTGDQFRDILLSKGSDGGALRAHCLSHARDSFMCLNDTGFLLPDEIVATTFVFCARAGPGYYNSSWILEFVPEDTAIFAPAAGPGVGLGADNGSAKNNASNGPTQISVRSVGLNLHGQCNKPDEGGHRRDFISLCFERGTINATCRDVVYSCVRRVRDAVRLPQLHDRQVALFCEKNRAHLEGLSARYAAMLPVFVTAERLEAFCGVYTEAAALLVVTRTQLKELRSRSAEIDAANAEAAEAVSDAELEQGLDAADAMQLSPALVAGLRSQLFPEDVIEIFDEVDASQITPRWNYDVSVIQDGLQAGLVWAEEVELLEEKIKQYETVQEKLRLKAERRAARCAAGDSDDEDSDEDEEEEDDEDKPIKPLHPLAAQLQDLSQQLQGALLVLVTRPAPSAAMESIARECLLEFVDSLVDCHQAALEQAEVTDVCDAEGAPLPVPPLPSPFTSADGAAVWEHALKQTSSQPEEAGGKGGKGAKAKPKAGKGAPTYRSEFTEQEVHYFYRVMYDNVRRGLLDAAVSMFDRVSVKAHGEAPAAALEEYGMAGQALFDVAALRVEDVNSAGAVVDGPYAGAGVIPPIVANTAKKAAGTTADSGDEASAASTVEGCIACVSFDGSAFTRANAVHSAFSLADLRKQQAVAPILKLASLGAAAAVLVYETPYFSTADNRVMDAADASTDRLLPYCGEIEALVTKLWRAQQEQHTKQLRKQKLLRRRDPDPVYRGIRFERCTSVADLYHRTDQLVGAAAAAAQQHPLYALTVLVLENIAAEGVVPVEPPFEEVESDEDEAPVEIGLQESQKRKRDKWDALRPHRVEVTVDNPTNGAGGGGAGGTLRVKCFADRAAAVAEAYTALRLSAANAVSTREVASSPLVWVEGAATKLFDPSSALNAMHTCAHKVKTVRLKQPEMRFVSDDVREACVWTGLLQQLPRAKDLLDQACATAPPDQAVDVTESAEEGVEQGGALVSDTAVETVGYHSTGSAAHFASVFPYSHHHHLDGAGTGGAALPTSAAVVGGTLRAEKFRVIDELIDLVDSVCIVGEMGVAFVALSQRMCLRQYAAQCAPYRAVCRRLVGRARARGCRLVWPVDLLCGDELITAEVKQAKIAAPVDPESRADGFEYDGDVKVVRVCLDTTGASSSAGNGDTPGVDGKKEEMVENMGVVNVDGYAYDIGPESCTQLREVLQPADLVLVWGTAGLCEASAFQTGQQCLVECASTKLPADNSAAASGVAPPADALERNPQRAVLVGGATVEWFARIIDSDGELGGDLVGAGAVDFASRDSTVFTGLLGQLPSPIVQDTLLRRPAAQREWVYSKRKFDVEEDEDEEDSDEEEEEDE